MADNTTINRGTDGDTIATDDIDGVKHQKVKMEFGGDGVATEVTATTPFPTTPASGGASMEEILIELKSINFHLNLITEGTE